MCFLCPSTPRHQHEDWIGGKGRIHNVVLAYVLHFFLSILINELQVVYDRHIYPHPVCVSISEYTVWEVFLSILYGGVFSIKIVQYKYGKECLFRSVVGVPYNAALVSNEDVPLFVRK